MSGFAQVLFWRKQVYKERAESLNIFLSTFHSVQTKKSRVWPLSMQKYYNFTKIHLQQLSKQNLWLGDDLVEICWSMAHLWFKKEKNNRKCKKNKISLNSTHQIPHILWTQISIKWFVEVCLCSISTHREHWSQGRCSWEAPSEPEAAPATQQRGSISLLQKGITVLQT